MAKIYIVTDSTADLPRSLVEKYNITVVPLKVKFEDGVYLDGVDLTSSGFFAKLEASKKPPVTSPPSPEEFVASYQPLVDQGATIISIHISTKMSGTIEAAQKAKEILGYPDIEIFDSQTVSVALGLMVTAAARAAAQGLAKAEIMDLLKNVASQQSIFFMVDTLDYLKRGGRISMTQAFLGTLFNIKPLCSIKDGLIYPHEKIRGKDKALNRIIELMAQNYPGEKVRAYLAHGNDPQALAKLRAMVQEKLTCVEIVENQMGPVVGTHVGPGVAGLAVARE